VVTIVLPLTGIVLRSFVEYWGEGVKLADVLTLQHFRDIWSSLRWCAASSTRS
jgi:iron(III) transport system permease protein